MMCDSASVRMSDPRFPALMMLKCSYKDKNYNLYVENHH